MSLTTQIVGISLIALMILIMFVTLLMSTFDLYYSDTVLTEKQIKSRKTLKFMLYLSQLFFIIDVFVALVVLLRFMIKHDIVDMIYYALEKYKTKQ